MRRPDQGLPGIFGHSGPCPEDRHAIPDTVPLPRLARGAITYRQSTWTLQQCADRAVEKNLAVRAAELDRDIAGQDLRAANFGFLPDLNAAATHGYNWGQAIDRYTNTFATDRTAPTTSG